MQECSLRGILSRKGEDYFKAYENTERAFSFLFELTFLGNSLFVAFCVKFLSFYFYSKSIMLSILLELEI